MRISDWSSDVCSSDLCGTERHPPLSRIIAPEKRVAALDGILVAEVGPAPAQTFDMTAGQGERRGNAGSGYVFGEIVSRPGSPDLWQTRCIHRIYDKQPRFAYGLTRFGHGQYMRPGSERKSTVTGKRGRVRE